MPKVPEKIGKYLVEELIAQGGMGAVYKAKHPTLGKNVILKKLTLKNDPQIIQRFTREAQIMMEFNSENIVKVYDHFKYGDSFYIVLEYINGINLGDFIKKFAPITNELALYIVGEIIKALDYSHKKGVIHRDIKPANILISRNGDIKLVDFGIATYDDVEQDDEELTTVGVTMGTPSYMSPEQFQDSKNVDKRADIYSLGVILYELLTNVRPFPGTMNPECLAKIQKGSYTKPIKVNKDVNTFSNNLVKKLMHHNRNKRPSDLQKVLKTIKRKTKKIGDHNFNRSLQESIIGGEITQSYSVKSKKPIIITLLILSVVATSIYFFDKYNLRYYLFGRNSYGITSIKLKISKNYYKEFDEIFIKSKLFLEDGPELKFIEGSNYKFSVNELSNDDFNIYRTSNIFLPVGYYRLKLMVDGNLFWRNFTVLPLGKSPVNTLELTHTESEPLPFNPTFRVIDQVTKEDITDSVNVLIRLNNKFENYNKNIHKLKTGQVHYFQFTKKGYFPKDYILKISGDQTDLKLVANIFPKPGELNISANVDKVDFTIDDKEEYLVGDRSGDFYKLPRIGESINTLQLYPGEYNFRFRYKRRELELTATIKSGETTTITVNYNKDNREITAEAK